MAKRIGHQTYEVAPGVQVMPICGSGLKQNGWQVVIQGEYADDFPLKRDAVAYAERYAAKRN